MKVAHLDTGRSWRGGQAQILLLLEGLRASGVENALIAPNGPLLDRARAAGFATHPWTSRGELDVGAMVRAARLMRGADIAHAHSAHAHALGVPAARWDRIPVVVSRRVDFEVGGNPLSRIKYRMPVDRYLCISRGVRSVMARAGIPDSRLALVPSGVAFREPPATLPADVRELVGAPAGTPIIGTVAALAPHKDHANLMRAAAVLTRERPDVHFVWIGEGECRGALERQRCELGLERHVHLLGFRDDAIALLSQFTLFALSSYLEGLCTSLLDAQRCGIPIVATATGGIPDVVEDGVTGRLTPVRDPAAFAAAILEALAQPERARSWAAAARRTVESFRAERMVEKTLAVYRDVLFERGASA